MLPVRSTLVFAFAAVAASLHGQTLLVKRYVQPGDGVSRTKPNGVIYVVTRAGGAALYLMVRKLTCKAPKWIES